eukprot:CAMPEP_0196578312 /NCGR_PEP_ID=MMETSP1081-20130531/7232_1 /TAXON_ID=36882 /ORGANISM="Pyramimonas amylifera, Strain CCMP720" /LENGTH=210 /DNA_ID=CAMNT_0041897487 /DNA_START=131 /DNA_END=763 /DNA_ORIENTATION=+
MNRKVLLVSIILPPVVGALTHKLLLKPQARRRKEKKEAELRRRYNDELQAGRDKAAGEIKLLEAAVARSLERECSSDPPGLVIEAAFFGDAEAITRAAARVGTQPPSQPETSTSAPSSGTPGPGENGMEGELGSGCLEVCTALQFLVEDSKLDLPEGISFVGMMGFCDPCPWREEKELLIHYTFADQAYKARVKDCEALRIPQRSHATHH